MTGGEVDGLTATLSAPEAGTVVIRLDGELDLATRDQIVIAVRAVLPAFRPGTLVLDLAGVSVLDSAGIGALVSCWKLAHGADCALNLRNPRPLAYAQLRLTGLLDVFALPPPPPSGITGTNHPSRHPIR